MDEVLGALHAHQLRREVEQQRGVELAAVHRAVRVGEVAAEVGGEHVHREYPGAPRPQGRERLLVRVVAVRREDDERVDAGLLPGPEQIVHPAVQGLAAHRGVAGVRPLGGGVHAVFDRRGAQDVEAGGEIVGQPLGVVVVAGVREVRRIECWWTEVRAELVPRDSAELRGALAAAVAEARRLAARGMRAALLPRDAAFEQLEVAMEARGQAPGVERGVVILGADGEPVAWAGRHRFVPTRDTVASSATLRAVIPPFYVSLEARRQTQAGGTAVGSVLIDAAPAARDRDGAVSALFARRHGVTLRFYTPHLAPVDSTVFDYTTPDGRTLFSVQPIPPSQGDAKLTALHGAAGRAGAALAAALLFLFMVAPPGRSRWLVVLAAAWCLMRAPLGSALGLASLFSSALFYRPMLGMFSASAGSLVVLGLVLLLAAALRWRGGVARRWWSLSAAAVLVLAAPYVVRYFGRGIAPPAGGVSFGLWISWQLAVAAASMALVVWAAALVRGTAEPRGVPWTLPAACAWAVLAALAGLWLWQPYGAWPEWYTFVWLPALVGVLVPAPSRWAVCGIATVAGTAAALVTWGAAVEGRLGLAERDAAGLGRAASRSARPRRPS